MPAADGQGWRGAGFGGSGSFASSAAGFFGAASKAPKPSATPPARRRPPSDGPSWLHDGSQIVPESGPRKDQRRVAESARSHVLQHDPLVKFLRASMKAVGCDRYAQCALRRGAADGGEADTVEEAEAALRGLEERLAGSGGGGGGGGAAKALDFAEYAALLTKRDRLARELRICATTDTAERTEAIRCVTCPMAVGGGYHPPSGLVLLCDNNMTGASYASASRTITHELVHAFDHCRTDIDWTNCKQHACTEIRASNLSTECRFFQELQRLEININGGQADCVRRRAELSVSMNPHCRGAKAAVAVDEVFDACYKDTAPCATIP